MTKAKSKRKPASRTNNSKPKTRKSVRRTTARKTGQLEPATESATRQQPRLALPLSARRESKKAHIIAMLRAPDGVTIEAMTRATKWQPHSVRGFLAGVVRKKLGLNLFLSRRTPQTGASIGLRIAHRQRRHRAMRPTRPVAKKTTRLSIDDVIAHLRDLDLHGLRARWKSMFRRRPLAYLPRHLLFAVLAYQLQVDELGDLDPATARLLRQIATSRGTGEASRLTKEFGRRGNKLKPGTILLREWNAQAYRVMVVNEGFAWNGKTS